MPGENKAVDFVTLGGLTTFNQTHQTPPAPQHGMLPLVVAAVISVAWAQPQYCPGRPAPVSLSVQPPALQAAVQAWVAGVQAAAAQSGTPSVQYHMQYGDTTLASGAYGLAQVWRVGVRACTLTAPGGPACGCGVGTVTGVRQKPETPLLPARVWCQWRCSCRQPTHQPVVTVLVVYRWTRRCQPPRTRCTDWPP
jgi:hypothetical protein